MAPLQLRPKLAVEDADDAITFYQQVLQAQLRARYTAGDAVVFAELALPDGGVLLLKDADEHDPAPPPGGGGVILDIECPDPDAVAQAAVAHGAQIVFEVADQPYGARQGRFRDPFGHQWIVGTPLTAPPDQVQAAMDRLADG